MRLLSLITFAILGVSSFCTGVELAKKVYADCAGLEGDKYMACQSEAFSKARLVAGSQEDLYAQQTQTNNGAYPDAWYRPPVAEDGRLGTSLQ